MQIKSQKSKIKNPTWRAIGIFAFCLLIFDFVLPANATNLYLRNAASKLVPPDTGWYWYSLLATNGSSMSSTQMNSIAGPVSGQYWPSATSGHILQLSSNSWRQIFISPPLSSGVTISGAITPNLWGLESAVQCNCGARYEVLRWSVAEGGIVSSLGISTDDALAEWGTTAAVRTGPTLTPTSTAFSTGDRIVLVIYNDDGNGVTEASGRSWTLHYNAATGVDGDTYLTFTETISLSSDSNNARAFSLLSLLRNLVARLWETIWNERWGMTGGDYS